VSERNEAADPALGWAYVEGLLLEEEVARLEGLDENALDEELREAGLDPALAPSAEALIAKADARSAAKQIDPAKGWAYVEKLIEKDEPRPVPSVDDFLAKAALKATAKATEAEPAAPGAGSAEPPPARNKPLTWWRRRAAAIAVAVAAAGGGVAYVAANQLPLVGAAAEASSLRKEALVACQQQDWATCKAKLDDARDLEPNGEDLPEVRDARAKIARAGQ
jgi:hypothetical protein